MQGQYALAREEYTRAQSFSPNIPEVLAGTGSIACIDHDYDKATKDFTLAAASSTHFIYPYVQLAWLNLHQNALDKAEVYFKQAVAVGTRDSSVALVGGGIELLEHHAQGARDLWTRALRECVFETMRQRIDHVIISYALGDRAGAIENLKKITAPKEALAVGCLHEAAGYIEILSKADSKRFAPLREMFSKFDNPLVPEN
jgi:Tfp pilus assembly protein PilF